MRRIKFEIWQEIRSTLKYNRMRTFLTSFGVFLGIFLLVLLVGAGNALNGGIGVIFENMATNSAFVWTNSTSIPYKGYQRGRNWQINNNDIKSIKENVEGVDYVVPRIMASNHFFSMEGGNVERKGQLETFTIYGDYPDYQKFDKLDLPYGRFLNQKDMVEERKVCVIGERVLQTMFDSMENPVGKYMRINGIYFQVVGVFKPVSEIFSMGDRKEETIFIPLTVIQKTYNLGDNVDMLSVVAAPDYKVSEIEEDIKKIIKRNHKIHPDDELALGTFNIEAELDKFQRLFSNIGYLTLIVGIGILISGVIGVGNIMMVVIKERTKTIGIQRSVGATPFNIVIPILLESVVVTAAAGLLGLSTAVLLLEGLASMLKNVEDAEIFGLYLQIDFKVALYALSILLFGGLLAGAFPAQRALRIKPVDALRDE